MRHHRRQINSGWLFYHIMKKAFCNNQLFSTPPRTACDSPRKNMHKVGEMLSISKRMSLKYLLSRRGKKPLSERIHLKQFSAKKHPPFGCIFQFRASCVLAFMIAQSLGTCIPARVFSNFKGRSHRARVPNMPP